MNEDINQEVIDVVATPAEELEVLKQSIAMSQNEINELNERIQTLQSDMTMLKETIIRMTMKQVGVL